MLTECIKNQEKLQKQTSEYWYYSQSILSLFLLYIDPVSL